MEYNLLRTRETFLKERPSKMLNMELSPRNAMHDSSHKFTVGSTLVNVGKKSATRVLQQEKMSKFCTYSEVYPESLSWGIDSGVVGTNPLPLVQGTSHGGNEKERESDRILWLQHTVVTGCSHHMRQARSSHYLWQPIVSFFNLTPWGLLADRCKNRRNYSGADSSYQQEHSHEPHPGSGF